MMYSVFNIKHLETYGFAKADLLINPCTSVKSVVEI